MPCLFLHIYNVKQNVENNDSICIYFINYRFYEISFYACITIVIFMFLLETKVQKSFLNRQVACCLNLFTT